MALEKEEISALRPDALGPADTEAKAETVGIGKASMSVPKMFVSAMLAGAFIAFGGMFFCTVLGDATLSFAVQRVLGGLVFCLGLTLVLCCGAELFTGNCLMICGASSKRYAVGAMLKNWVVVWVGNLVGALIVVLLVFASHLADMNGAGVGSAALGKAKGVCGAGGGCAAFGKAAGMGGTGVGSAAIHEAESMAAAGLSAAGLSGTGGMAAAGLTAAGLSAAAGVTAAAGRAAGVAPAGRAADGRGAGGNDHDNRDAHGGILRAVSAA